MSLEQHPERAEPPAIRASDAEREEIVRQLSVAVGEGRLSLEEHIARVDRALESATRPELDLLVADLPVPAATTEAPVRRPAGRRRWIVSIMGEHHRTGRWRLSGRTVVVTVMGETVVDLRGALLDEPEVHIAAWLLMGEQRVIVPRGLDVEVTGFLLMGSRKIHLSGDVPRPGAPKVRVRTLGAMGELVIETR